jgi:hypothetical protein
MRYMYLPRRCARTGSAALLAAAMLGADGAAEAQVHPTGSFLADRIDASPLPVTDRVTDDDGTTYLVEFDRLVLALDPDRRFRASVRYRRTLWSRDARSRARGAPLQTLTVSGTYEIVDTEIRFTPDDAGQDRGLRMLAGRVESARRISVPFDYRNGNLERRRTLRLARRDDIL